MIDHHRLLRTAEGNFMELWVDGCEVRTSHTDRWGNPTGTSVTPEVDRVTAIERAKYVIAENRKKGATVCTLSTRRKRERQAAEALLRLGGGQ